MARLETAREPSQAKPFNGSCARDSKPLSSGTVQVTISDVNLDVNASYYVNDLNPTQPTPGEYALEYANVFFPCTQNPRTSYNELGYNLMQVRKATVLSPATMPMTSMNLSMPCISEICKPYSLSNSTGDRNEHQAHGRMIRTIPLCCHPSYGILRGGTPSPLRPSPIS
jgi:hypothetical protein